MIRQRSSELKPGEQPIPAPSTWKPTPPKMTVYRTQIKTVQRCRDCYEEFDREVNQLLMQGWTLVERFDAPGFDMGFKHFAPLLVAYLERRVALADNVNEDYGR